MRWEDTNEQTCSIARSVSVFGDRWTLLIVRQIFMRMRKFSEIQASLDINKHRLSDRLNRLIENGVLTKKPYGESGKRFEYRLTEKGLDLYPIMLLIAQWGDKWMVDDDGPPINYVHKNCGQILKPVLRCSHCDTNIDALNSYATAGPGILRKLERNEFTNHDIKLYSKSLIHGT